GHVPDAGLPKGFAYADGRAPSAPQPEGCLIGVAQ
ncbi:hydroxymethylglutaryl-CoA lyase, partial [Paraburkholderia mimosarum]